MWMINDNSSNLIGFEHIFCFFFKLWVNLRFSCCPISINDAFQKLAFFMIRNLSCIESARADKLEIGLIKRVTSYTYFNCANINFDIRL